MSIYKNKNNFQKGAFPHMHLLGQTSIVLLFTRHELPTNLLYSPGRHRHRSKLLKRPYKSPLISSLDPPTKLQKHPLLFPGSSIIYTLNTLNHFQPEKLFIILPSVSAQKHFLARAFHVYYRPH